MQNIQWHECDGYCYIEVTFKFTSICEVSYCQKHNDSVKASRQALSPLSIIVDYFPILHLSNVQKDEAGGKCVIHKSSSGSEQWLKRSPFCMDLSIRLCKDTNTQQCINRQTNDEETQTMKYGQSQDQEVNPKQKEGLSCACHEEMCAMC